MSSADFSLLSRFAKDLPAPAPRFGGFPKYNFVGGHNDPERIPIEGLIEATAPCCGGRARKLAMYNLAQGPQGYHRAARDGRRQAEAASRHERSRDEVLVTTGSGQGIDMISRMFVDPGDTVILEEFCYAGAINRFKRDRRQDCRRSSWMRTGCGSTCWLRTLEELKAKGRHAEIHLHDPDDPEPTGQHPAAGASAAAAGAGAAVRRADI